MDQEHVQIKAQIEKNFKIVDVEGQGLQLIYFVSFLRFLVVSFLGSGIVKLVSQHKNETIEVTFDCQGDVEIEPNFNEEGDNDEGEEGGDDDEEQNDDFEDRTGVAFTVTVTKGDQKIEFSCVASDSFTIENVQYLGTESSDSKEVYGGPHFSELEDLLQQSFYQYLEERHIDEDMSFFVLSYANAKEHREYLNWLHKLSAFTSKK